MPAPFEPEGCRHHDGTRSRGRPELEELALLICAREVRGIERGQHRPRGRPLALLGQAITHRHRDAQHAPGIPTQPPTPEALECAVQRAVPGGQRAFESPPGLRSRASFPGVPLPEVVGGAHRPARARRTAVDVVERRVDEELERDEVERDDLGKGVAALERVRERSEDAAERSDPGRGAARAWPILPDAGRRATARVEGRDDEP